MVKPLTYLSDHHMIVTHIRVNNKEKAKNSIHNTESNYYTYKWTNERKAVYCKALSLLIREDGDELLNADIKSRSDLDKFQININDMIIGTADKVLIVQWLRTGTLQCLVKIIFLHFSIVLGI